MTSKIEPNWMTPIKQFLIDGTCVEHSKKTIKQQATGFVLIGEELYRGGYTCPLLKCLTPDQATYVIRELHLGICGTHLGVRTMVAKVVRTGYYWRRDMATAQNLSQKV